MTISTMASQAVVLYRETFGNDLGGSSASVNWRYLSTGAATDISSANVFGGASVPATNLPNVNTSVNSSATAGHWGPTISNISLLTPNSVEQAGFSGVDLNPADYSSLTLSWYSGVALATTTQRLAIQIGTNWYATNATYVNVFTGSFATGAVQESVTFSTTASAWRDLTVTPGSALTLAGTARTLALPSGPIVNFGILSEAAGSSSSRVDTFQIDAVAIPEPAAWMLLGSGLFLVAGLRRRGKVVIS